MNNFYLTHLEKRFSEKSKKDYFIATIYDFKGETATRNVFITEKCYNNYKDKIKNSPFVPVPDNEFDFRPLVIDNQTVYTISYIGG